MQAPFDTIQCITFISLRVSLKTLLLDDDSDSSIRVSRRVNELHCDDSCECASWSKSRFDKCYRHASRPHTSRAPCQTVNPSVHKPTRAATWIEWNRLPESQSHSKMHTGRTNECAAPRTLFEQAFNSFWPLPRKQHTHRKRQNTKFTTIISHDNSSLPFRRFQGLFHSLFRVLFTFRSHYLFAIGLPVQYLVLDGMYHLYSSCNLEQLYSL